MKLRILFVTLGVILLGAVGTVGLWLLSPPAAAAGGWKSAGADPAPSASGCAPHEVIHDFSRHPASARRADDGKVIEAIIVRGRYPCAPILGPAVAFNWYSLKGRAGHLADIRYKAYAAPIVAQDAGVGSVVMYLEHPQVVAKRVGAGGPGRVNGVAMPLVNDVATMPFYPSPDSTLRMIDHNAERYFKMLRIKRAAIGDDGYFSYQECLFDCERLRQPKPLPENASRLAYLTSMRETKVRTPVLVVHVAMDPEAVVAHLAPLSQTGPNLPKLAYFGRTMADTVIRMSDGTERPGLQKPHWIAATAAFSLSPGQTPQAALATPALADFIAKSSTYVALFYPDETPGD